MITIAVGVGENKNILKAIDNFDDIDFKLVHDDKELLNSILDSDIDCVIRGSLPASKVISQLKSQFPNVFRSTYIKDENHEFLIAPVGIDEGNCIEEKLRIAVECGNFLEKLSVEPKIAILSKAREGDYGRGYEIDQSIEQGNKLECLIRKKTNLNVTNYNILIEQAIRDKCNVLIPPDGIIGNYLFRTFVIVNGWPSYGAVTFGLDKTYIDTSRDQTVEGYERSIKLGCRLHKL